MYRGVKYVCSGKSPAWDLDWRGIVELAQEMKRDKRKDFPMNRKCLLLSLLILISNFSLSQTIHIPSTFISALKDFSKTYDSNLGFAFGAGVGFPLSKISNRMYLYGKATYFSKRGVPVLYSYYYEDGVLVRITERKDGSETFKQWIINCGLQYNLFLLKDFTLGLNGGLTYSAVINKWITKNGTEKGSWNESILTGDFVGIGLEKNFINSPFTIFVEAQYNFTWHVLKTYWRNYGGTNLTVGLRYYFKK